MLRCRKERMKETLAIRPRNNTHTHILVGDRVKRNGNFAFECDGCKQMCDITGALCKHKHESGGCEREPEFWVRICFFSIRCHNECLQAYVRARSAFFLHLWHNAECERVHTVSKCLIPL